MDASIGSAGVNRSCLCPKEGHQTAGGFRTMCVLHRTDLQPNMILPNKTVEPNTVNISVSSVEGLRETRKQHVTFERVASGIHGPEFQNRQRRWNNVPHPGGGLLHVRNGQKTKVALPDSRNVRCTLCRILSCEQVDAHN